VLKEPHLNKSQREEVLSLSSVRLRGNSVKMNKPEVLVHNKYHLAESPHWCAKRQKIYYVDITNHMLMSYDPKTKDNNELQVQQEGARSLTFILPVQLSDTDFVIGLDQSISVVTWDGKHNGKHSLKALQHFEPEFPNNSNNDGKADYQGRIWFGTFDRDVEKTRGSVYRVDGPNKSSKEATDILLSNGLDFSPDGKTFYFVDSRTNKVDAFDLDINTGKLSNRRVVFDLRAHGLQGFPDGLAVDERNNVWVACMGPGLLAEVKPDLEGGKGQLLGVIDFPETNSVTAACFGGPDLNDLYVTTAKLFDPDSKNAGSLFVVRGVKSHSDGKKVRGLPGREVAAKVVRGN